MKSFYVIPCQRSSNLFQQFKKSFLPIKSIALLSSNNLLKRAFILLFFVLFSGIELYAQHNFREGYIITLNNDTLHGSVDYRSNTKNYHSCIFKKGNNILEYLPSQINGYGYIHGKFYASGVMKNSFVETLVIGTLSLYKKNGIFYLKKYGKVYTLEEKEEKIVVHNIDYIQSDTRWKQTILDLTNDCLPNVQKLANQLEYSELQITNLVIRYNNCRKTPYREFNQNLPWFKINIGGGIGLVKRKLFIESYYSDAYYYLPSSYNSIDPTFGLVVNMSSPRFSNIISLQSEIYYIHSSFSNYIFFNGGTYKSLQSHIELTTLTIPVFLVFSINRKLFSYFVQTGFDYNFNTQRDIKVTGETYSNTNVPIETDLAINGQTIGYFGGIGVQRSFKKVGVGINLRYYPKMKLRPFSLYRLYSNRISLTLVISKK